MVEAGIPPGNSACPAKLYQELWIITREEAVKVSVSPRASDMVARVTIKGAIFKYPMDMPLSIPKATAAPMVTANPATPAGNGAVCPISCITSAPAAPENAMTDPTDKSMPPVSITIVMAIAARAVDAACRRIFITVFRLKKPADTMENHTNSIAVIAAMVKYRKLSSFSHRI